MSFVGIRRLAVVVLAVGAVSIAPSGANDPAQILDQGMTTFKAGKFAEAAAEFQTLVDTAPDYDYGYFMLGNCMLRMKKPADAEKNFNEAIRLNGDKALYYHGLANAYSQQKKHTEAIGTLTKGESLATDNNTRYAFYSLRGSSYAALSKWPDAINDLEKAAMLKRSTKVLSQLGRAYFELNHHDKSVETFREVVKANPNDGSAQEYLANSLISVAAETSDKAAKKATYAEALQAADKARSLKGSDNYASYNLIGQAALGAGDFKRADQAFAQALQKKPTSCYAMINLSKVAIAEERWKDAEARLVEAAKCAPKMEVVPLNLGFVYLKQERYEEALVAYRKSDQIKPSSAAKEGVANAQNKIEVRDHNLDAAKREAAMAAAAEAEKKRIEEEEKKIEEYKKKHEDG